MYIRLIKWIRQEIILPELEDAEYDEILLVIRKQLRDKHFAVSLIPNPTTKSVDVIFRDRGFSFQLSEFLNQHLGLDRQYIFQNSISFPIPTKYWMKLFSEEPNEAKVVPPSSPNHDALVPATEVEPASEGNSETGAINLVPTDENTDYQPWVIEQESLGVAEGGSEKNIPESDVHTPKERSPPTVAHIPRRISNTSN